MANKITLEEEVRSMKKHSVGLVALVKDLKARVEKFEGKGKAKCVTHTFSNTTVLRTFISK